jgi:hypothetical protein
MNAQQVLGMQNFRPQQIGALQTTGAPAVTAAQTTFDISSIMGPMISLMMVMMMMKMMTGAIGSMS